MLDGSLQNGVRRNTAPTAPAEKLLQEKHKLTTATLIYTLPITPCTTNSHLIDARVKYCAAFCTDWRRPPSTCRWRQGSENVVGAGGRTLFLAEESDCGFAHRRGKDLRYASSHIQRHRREAYNWTFRTFTTSGFRPSTMCCDDGRNGTAYHCQGAAITAADKSGLDSRAGHMPAHLGPLRWKRAETYISAIWVTACRDADWPDRLRTVVLFRIFLFFYRTKGRI